MHMKKKLIAACAVLVGLLCVWGILDTMSKKRIATVEYTLESTKIAAPVRLLIAADLHNARFGANQGELMDAIAAAAPDAVLLCGDLFHKDGPDDETLAFLKLVGKEYPCFYVTGNHEYRKGNGSANALCDAARACGITVLRGRSALFTAANGQTVQLLGVDWQKVYDPKKGELAAIAKQRRGDLYAVALVHEPTQHRAVLSLGFDLMVSGHTHGGQWRVPGLLNGVYAPGQGLFPRFAGGSYEVGGKRLVVSRGLSKQPACIPRFNNPPELTLVTLLPAA